MKYTTEIIDHQINSIHDCVAVHYNRTWDAYNASRFWWEEAGLKRLFENVWGKGIDLTMQCRDSLREAFNNDDKELLGLAANDLNSIGSRFQDTARRIYAYEDCWNPRLPQSLTKVLGHTYTCSEYVTQQTQMLGDSLCLTAKWLKEAAEQNKKFIQRLRGLAAQPI